MSTTPPPSAAPVTSTPTVTTPKKKSPKKASATKRPKLPPSPKDATSAKGSSSSAAASPDSPNKAAARPFTPALKAAAIALKLRGMPVNKIAVSLGVNYKTVWNHVDKATKNKAKVGKPDGPSPSEMSEADKRDAALALKLIGRSTKEIAEILDMNYKTIWNYLDKQQKAAGLPAMIRDPDM